MIPLAASGFWPPSPSLWSVVVLTAAVLTMAALSKLIARAEATRRPIANPLRATRNLVVPVLAIWLLAAGLGVPPVLLPALRVLETILWIFVIHAALSFANTLFFAPTDPLNPRGRVPKLFLDITRSFLVLVGAAIVYSTVWDKDLGGLLAALGVGSIVIGLALQDTLGNLMAGIALLFERPFAVGDWIKVGENVGQIIEMNWRSTRVRTRQGDMIVVPNSILGKEMIYNFSRPSVLHCETYVIGFSYDDPPNQVKRVLLSAALQSPGVLKEPRPLVRTRNYADFFIEYVVYLWTDDYGTVNEMIDGFASRLWYAAKRNGLTIPFPIQTHLEGPPPKATDAVAPREALKRVPVFVPLDEEELARLARDADLQSFGRGERIVHQGDPGDALYVVLAGTAVVSVSDELGGEREVARLGRGEFFGEQALLTGEPRNAHVTASEDSEVLRLGADEFKELIARRPNLALELAEIMEARRQGLRTVKDLRPLDAVERQQVRSGSGEMLAKIKRFFGL